MTKKATKRQNIRRGVMIVFLLLFPVIMNYLSPYVILFAASEGIINGSFILFALLFLSSLFLGRLWCAWICPGGAMGAVCMLANNKPIKYKWLDYVKWVIWVVWLGLIAFFAYNAGGYTRVDPFLLTQNGVSVSEPAMYIIYYIVTGTFFLLAILLGRRGGCHTICWMSPFMIIGRKIRNFFAWPSFRLRAVPETCIACKKCTKECPMSLDVQAMVAENAMENAECILCATCADICPTDSIHFEFSAGK